MDNEKETTISASPSTLVSKSSLYMGLTSRQIGRKPSSNALPVNFEAAAEDQLVHQKSYADTKCALPNNTRSTFLMVFSPDGKLVASTHGDHCVYVCNVATGACVRTLSGHPRTPWCLAFHPTSSQLLASGCLGGQVRVWDLSGGSEMWCADDQTVIASLAFHPSSDRLLVIATYNELLFWDWSKPKPFAKCCTRNDKEKVRFVTFDPLGHNLITGIANRYTPPTQWDQQATSATFYSRPSTSALGRDQQQRDRVSADVEMPDRQNLGPSNNTESGTSGPSNSASWEWTAPFSNLLQEYESLVQRCRERFNTPVGRSSTNRVDRGTNTQESGSSTVNSQETPSSVSTSNTTTTATLGVAGASNRLSAYMQCISRLEDSMATTNIERLRNPLLQEPTSVTPTSTPSSRTARSLLNLTVPCSVNLGERVSEESLRRLREMWREQSTSASSTSSPSTNTTETNTEPRRSPVFNFRRRRRFPASFDNKRETKRLRTSFDTAKRESGQRTTTNSANAASSSTTENSAKDSTSSERPRTETASSQTTSSAAVGNDDNLGGSIYDNPQPGTSREPEVILILSDSDSSSDPTEVPIPPDRLPPSVPVIDLTDPIRNDTRSYVHRNRIDRRMRLVQLLNRTRPLTPRFLQRSQQSAFRPQTPRNEEPTTRPTASVPNTRRPPTVPRFLRASADLGVRYAIRMLSRHIDVMERRCRARLEVLQLEQIRRLWEEFMTQLSSLNSTLSTDSSLRRDDGAEDEASTSQNRDGANEALWTGRSEPESNETNHQPSTSNSQNSDVLDREAADALELAYEQLSESINNPGLRHEDMAMFNPNRSTSNLTSTGSNNRASLSGQVPDDATIDDPILNPENSSRNSTVNTSNTPASTTTAETSRSSSNRTGDNSEEYHSTLMRANQISVLRRLLTLLDRNDLPLDSNSTPTLRAQGPSNTRSNTARNDIPLDSNATPPLRAQGPSNTRSNTARNDISLDSNAAPTLRAQGPPNTRSSSEHGNLSYAYSTLISYERNLSRSGRRTPTNVLDSIVTPPAYPEIYPRTLIFPEERSGPADIIIGSNASSSPPRAQSIANSRFYAAMRNLGNSDPPVRTFSRPLRSGRSSPTEFLEELRSIQQSLARPDHVPSEIPSQEVIQRDLNRIVMLEAAVRERLRLSEDTLERSFLENQTPLGSPRPRELPLSYRSDRSNLFESLVESAHRLRRQHEEFGPPGGSNTMHARLNQPFLFRPPPEPPTSANPLDERTDSRRNSATDDWHQNINLLQTTRRQAWRVLGLMVRHVRQHIELHQLERYSEGSALQAHLQQLLSLLQRALELTDTLLTQMLATRREVANRSVQLRSTPADRPPRLYRHAWHPLETADFLHTPLYAAMTSVRGRDPVGGGAYIELQRRSLADTDSAVVNHLIQHFQRRTPESESSTSSINQNLPQEESVNSDRSLQLRQRLGGLWSCRRVPSSESQPAASSHLPTSSNTVPASRATPYLRRSRLPQFSRTEDALNGQSNSEVGESSPLYDSIRSRYNRVCTILDRLTQLDPSPQFRSWADNLRRLLEMPQRYFEAEDERQRSERRQLAFNVPSVRVNDVPVVDVATSNQQSRVASQPLLWGLERPPEELPSVPRQRSRSPSPTIFTRARTGGWRSWMYYPRNRGVPNSARDLFGASHQATMEGVRGAAASCPTTLTHRIQCWPFVEGNVPPDISNAQQCVVVASCRINNDASVDVSRDGRILVALVPSPRPGGHSKLGIYSLERATLGQVLFLTPLEQSPVSVCLSPSSRFLLVGIATKRFLTVRGESSPAAQVFRLPWEKDTKKSSPPVSLEPTRFIYQASEVGYVSMNCIRWAPVSGQGMVYGTNTGNLGILR